MEYQNIRSLLTGKTEAEMGASLIATSKDVTEEKLNVLETHIELLNSSFRSFTPISINFYENNDNNEDFLLPLLFSIATASPMIYGNMKSGSTIFESCWVELDEFIYNPSLSIFTNKQLYYRYFEKTAIYPTDEVINMYIKSDLREYGINIDKDEQQNLLKIVKEHKEDYANGKLEATLEKNKTEIVQNLEVQKIETKEEVKPKKKESKKYFFHDVDVTNNVIMKAAEVAFLISKEEQIPFEDAYDTYVSSLAFKELENTENGQFLERPEIVLNHYYEMKSERINK